MNSNWKALLLFGLAWPFLGLGFMGLHFGYFPTGMDLVGRAIGLFAAGAVSAGLLLVMRAGMHTPFARGLVYFGYLLFAPLGLMAGLLAPGPFEAAGESAVGMILVAPLAILLYAGMTVAFGLGFTGGLAVVAHSLSLRLQRHPAPAPVQVRA